jgi:hypothetical protein
VAVIGKVLERVNQAAAHGILGSEQERKKDHGHFSITEVLPATFVIGVFKGLNPTVEHALGFGAVRHGNLAPVCGKLEPAHSDLARLTRFPYFGAGKGEGKVDELKGVGDGPVLFIDFLRGTIRDVWAAKNTQGSVYIHVPGAHHDRLRRVGGDSPLEPAGEMLARYNVLDANVNSEEGNDDQGSGAKWGNEWVRNHIGLPQCLAGEQCVQTTTVLDVAFTRQEDPKKDRTYQAILVT